MGFRHYTHKRSCSKYLSKAEEELKLIEHFNQIVAINQDGRYEVQIPRNENHPPLLTKINVAKERILNC